MKKSFSAPLGACAVLALLLVAESGQAQFFNRRPAFMLRNYYATSVNYYYNAPYYAGLNYGYGGGYYGAGYGGFNYGYPYAYNGFNDYYPYDSLGDYSARLYTFRRDITYVGQPGGTASPVVAHLGGVSNFDAYTARLAPATSDGIALAGFSKDAGSDKKLPADITVAVPADAELWFQGQKTTQKGALRQFQTPALKPGSFTYEVKASWEDKGKKVQQTRTISVKAGDHLNVFFTQPETEKVQPETIAAPSNSEPSKAK